MPVMLEYLAQKLISAVASGPPGHWLGPSLRSGLKGVQLSKLKEESDDDAGCSVARRRIRTGKPFNSNERLSLGQPDAEVGQV